MTADQYAPPPPGAPPMGGPDDADAQALDDELEHRRRVRSAVNRLRIQDEARRLHDAERAANTPVPVFDAGTLDDILARPAPPPFRVDELIPSDAGTLLVAQRKTGKTTLSLNLARALITGTPFLGRLDVQKLTGRVAFLNFEVSAATLARWAHDQGIPGNRLFLVNLRGRRNPLTNDQDRDLLATKLRTLDVESVFVDPFGRAYTGASQNDPSEVGTFLADLDRFVRGDIGARDLILATHAGWDGERSRGSTALEDWADSIINLVRDPHDPTKRFLRAEGRDVHLPEDELLFDDRTRTLTLAGVGSRKSSAKQRQVEALMPAVADLLKTAPHMSGNQLDNALRDLQKSGDLEATFTRGDGARAAQRLEKAGFVISKEGPRGARLFSYINPAPPRPPHTSPQGGDSTSPTSLLEGRSIQGTQTTTTPQGSHPIDKPPAAGERGPQDDRAGA